LKRWPLVLGLVVLAVVAFGPAALGVDGLVAAGTRGAPDWARLATPGAGLAVLFACAQVAAFSAAWRGRLSPRIYVLCAWLLAAGMNFGLIAMSDAGGFSLAGAISMQGYANDGALFADATELLSEYNARHAELLPHSTTHPPGPALLYQTIGRVGSGLTGLVPGTAGFSSREVLRLAITENLTGGLVVLCAWLWLAPLALLVRLLASRRAALCAVGLAAGLPAMHVIAPMPDVLHPLLVTTAALAAVAATRSARHAFGLGVLTGLAAAALALFGVGNLIALPLLALLLVLASDDLRAATRAFTGVLVGLAASYALLRGLGYDYIAGMRLSLAFHDAGINTQRAYLPYLFGSPYTFLLWLGPPVLVGAARCLRARTNLANLARGTLLLLVALTLAGTSRGETERLWLPLAPFFIVCATAVWTRDEERAPIELSGLIGLTLLFSVAFKVLTTQYT
jgi:hypothetical protein